MVKKTVLLWLTGFLLLFIVEALVRVTMKAPYFMAGQIVTFLLYGMIGCVSGLFFGFAALAIGRMFSDVKISYGYVHISMSAFITCVLSISLFFYLFKAGELLGSASYIVKLAVVFCFSVGSFFALCFFFRWNGFKGKLFVSYFSILPPLFLIATLTCNQCKWDFPEILRISSLAHLVVSILIAGILFLLLYVTLPFCSPFIVKWKRVPFFKLILLLFSVILFSMIFTSVSFKRHNQKNEIHYTPEGNFNIVLITMDTARADHLSCYGYKKLTTPNVDQLAREGGLYKNAYATSSWTLPSHASIFTGMYPSKHGAHFNPDFRSEDVKKQTGRRFTAGEMIRESLFTLSEKNSTLAEVLAQRGYRSAGIVGGPFVSSIFGIAQGFDYYDEVIVDCKKDVTFYLLYQVIDVFYSLQDFAVQYGYAVKRLASHLNKAAFAWLEKNETRPFFLFINYFDAHLPYIPPPSFTSDNTKKVSSDFILKRASKLNRSYVDTSGKVILGVISGQHRLTTEEREVLVSRYDDEIRYVDHCIGLLFERLKALNVYDNTLFIVTSDHGEAFGEHNLVDHGITLYEELIRIPLIIKYPSAYQQQGVVEKQVSLVDLFPTILALLNEPIPLEIDGQPLTATASAPRPIIAEWQVKWSDPERYQRTLMSIHQGKEKYIWASNAEHELYDLETDPGENINIFMKFPQRAESFEKMRKQWLSSFEPPARSGEKIKLNEGTIDKLRALGYVN